MAQTELLREFTRQKGLATFDDAEAPPAFELNSHHQVVVSVEHCTSARPSCHLRGKQENYQTYLNLLRDCLRTAAGDGELALKVNESGGASGNGLGETARSNGRPGSAPSSGGRHSLATLLRVDAFGNPTGRTFTGDGKYPRVGSFEVHVTLVNKKYGGGQRYGPVFVFSKIKSGAWPSMAKLRKTVDAALQRLLEEDDKACSLEREFRRQAGGDDRNAVAEAKTEALGAAETGGEATAELREHATSEAAPRVPVPEPPEPPGAGMEAAVQDAAAPAPKPSPEPSPDGEQPVASAESEAPAIAATGGDDAAAAESEVAAAESKLEAAEPAAAAAEPEAAAAESKLEAAEPEAASAEPEAAAGGRG